MSYHGPVPLEWNYCATCGKVLTEADDGQSQRPHCSQCNRFFYHNPVPATCCFVQDEAGSLLFVQRAVEPCKGHWSLPGGFMELGESAEESALRELQEETALVGAGLELIGASTRQSPNYGAVLVLGFEVTSWQGELHADTDAMDLAFFPKAERPPLPFEVHRELLAIFDQLHD